jgi:hypothetical protein
MIRELRIERLNGRKVILTRDETGWTLYAHNLRVRGHSIGACFAAVMADADRQEATEMIQKNFFKRKMRHNEEVQS